MLRVAAFWVSVIVALHVAALGAWGHETHRESFESEPEVTEPTPEAEDAAPEASTAEPDLAPDDVEPRTEPSHESSKHAAPVGVKGSDRKLEDLRVEGWPC